MPTHADTQSNPPNPNDPPNPTTDGGFEQPLPPDAEPESESSEPKASASCSGTAQLGTQVLSLAMAYRFGQPLSPSEAVEFHHDLEAVLSKYECPDFKYAEEAQLIGTTVGIVATRAMARAAEQAKRAAGEDRTVSESDSTSHREKGFGQNGHPPQAGVSSEPTEASVLLARSPRPN